LAVLMCQLPDTLLLEVDFAQVQGLIEAHAELQGATRPKKMDSLDRLLIEEAKRNAG
jgi:hypothetical protein